MKDTYARTNNICLVFLTLVAGTMALIYMRSMLIPLIFAIFVYSILTPAVKFLQKKMNIPKTLAVFASLILTALAFTLMVAIVISSIEDFVQGAPKYSESLNDSITYVENFLDRFDIQLDLETLRKGLTSPVLSLAPKLTGQLLSFFGNLFLVFIFTIFMMTGESRSQTKSPLLKEVLAKVSSYVSAKSLLSLATGFFVWIVLMFFGVELAFIFGLLTVLLNFIPTLGSIVAVILPLPVVFLQYQLGWSFFVILALTGFIQFFIGNVLEPQIMGDSMDLHPISILICLIFWGMVWGTAGMFLAVPITAVLRIVFARIEATEPLAELLAGRLPER